MTKSAYVYILASKKRGTLYTGVTNNLERRMYEHKHHLLDGFTSKYDVTRLVWFEQGEDIAAAISLEKKIKNRNRQWKIDLIEKRNPGWLDLSAGWMDSATPPDGSAQNDREGGFAQKDALRLSSPSAKLQGPYCHAPSDTMDSATPPDGSAQNDRKGGSAQNDGEGGPVRNDDETGMMDLL